MSKAEKPRKACCFVSELLEETGLDRKKVRQLKRQVLEGLVLFCQWQLERMNADRPAPSGRKARRVSVE